MPEVHITPQEWARALGEAWDRGWDSGHAQGEWGHSHKPRNPYTGEMNDDADDYCPEHGGRCAPEVCDHDSHWPPERLANLPSIDSKIVLPEIKVTRGGIRFGPEG
jgi:hypothetical protein